MDVDGLIARVPATAQIKGFFVSSYLKMLVKDRPALAAQLVAALPRPRYHPFSSYPRAEVMRFEIAVARILHPDVGDREALRRATRHVYPMFLSSLLGRVALGTLGNDVEAVLRLGPRMFAAMTNFGVVEVKRVSERHFTYHYRDYYSWLDSGDVGVLEGLLLYYGVEPEFRLAMVGEFEMFLDIQWKGPALPHG